MNRSLLIISCSDRKINTLGRIPAFERYDGQSYRIIRKAIREDCFPSNLDILIISAKLGLLRWDEEIKDYNQLMSKAQAHKLRPSIQENLESFLDGRDYNKLFINMGATYLETLEGFEWKKHFNEKIEAKGRIGEKSSQMKSWVRGQSQ